MDAPTGLERLDSGRAGADVEVVSGRRTVVTALPLKRAARDRLSRALGARVVDVRDECDSPDLVLTPSCSPQLIGALKGRYPSARVVVVELEDWDLGIELDGPVKRLLRSGADAYLLAASVDELADQLGAATTTPARPPDSSPTALPGGQTVDDLIADFLGTVRPGLRHSSES